MCDRVLNTFWKFRDFTETLGDRLQISHQILSEFKKINYLLFPQKSSQNHVFLMISEGIEVN